MFSCFQFCNSNRRSSSSDDLTLARMAQTHAQKPKKSRTLIPPVFMRSVDRPCSDLTRENCARIINEIKSQPLDLPTLQRIQTLLDRCTKGDNVLDIVDDKALNALQKAIIHNQVQVVQMLVNKHVDINAGECTLPLHLACKLGHANVVKVLLSAGARVDISCRLCYPVFHAKSVNPAQKQPCAVQIPKMSPLGQALANDRDEVGYCRGRHSLMKCTRQRQGLID